MKELKSIIGRHKINTGMLRILEEMEKPKELISMTHGHEL